MNLKPIKTSDLAPNTPLPRDIYDNDRNLMSAKCHVIENAERLRELSTHCLLITEALPSVQVHRHILKIDPHQLRMLKSHG